MACMVGIDEAANWLVMHLVNNTCSASSAPSYTVQLISCPGQGSLNRHGNGCVSGAPCLCEWDGIGSRTLVSRQCSSSAASKYFSYLDSFSRLKSEREQLPKHGGSLQKTGIYGGGLVWYSRGAIQPGLSPPQDCALKWLAYGTSCRHRARGGGRGGVTHERASFLTYAGTMQGPRTGK